MHSDNGEAGWPESKPYGFDPSNLIQIMLAQENMVWNKEYRAKPFMPVRQHWHFSYHRKFIFTRRYLR
jgi:hypothetical protein